MKTQMTYHQIAHVALVATLLMLSTVFPKQILATRHVHDHALETAPESATGLQDEMQTVLAKSTAALQMMASYWGGVFRSNGWRFVAPRTVINYNTMAHYDPRNHTINVNPVFLVQQMRRAAQELRTDGDMAYIIILAHEYGHAVQAQLGLTKGRSIDIELHADVLAGVFARAAHDEGLLDPGDEDEAARTLLSARDATGTSPYHPNAHGTGRQRLSAFNRGFEGGMRVAFR